MMPSSSRPRPIRRRRLPGGLAMIAHWPLAKKLLALGSAFIVLALGSIALTLWVSWQLEGGAAAVNEAGRMRMESYRLALVLAQSADSAQREAAAQALQASMERLRVGDPSRPLFVPWNADTRARFADVQQRWQALRQAWLAQGAPPPSLATVDAYVRRVDGLVGAVEHQLSGWTALLRAVQLSLVGLAVASTVAFFYFGHLFVLHPLQRLQRAVARLRDDDFSARVEMPARDEFGELAAAFNTMASHLQSLYGALEAKVQEKTTRLEVKSERLAALYEVSALIGGTDALAPLAEGFAALVRRVARADGVAVRWSASGNERYLMLAADGLPPALSTAEQCLTAGTCLCGQKGGAGSARVIPIASAGASQADCGRMGYEMLLTVPIALRDRVLGEVDLFFRVPREVPDEERSLYDTMASHLAGRMESLRAAALERETAVAQERTLLAQELHDSIAQSLAFLKIQVQLLTDGLRRHDEAAMQRSVHELDTGVKESLADVRELLLHFRTRAVSEDITAALRTTLQKFEHQSGVHTQLLTQGHGLPLPADVQIQVLHIVQEALSNVRKHAGAREVMLRVQQAPQWRFEVCDDGRGFEPDAARAETQVGLKIMRERAERIGATVELVSGPGRGTTMTLTLAAAAASTSNPEDEHADTTVGG